MKKLIILLILVVSIACNNRNELPKDYHGTDGVSMIYLNSYHEFSVGDSCYERDVYPNYYDKVNPSYHMKIEAIYIYRSSKECGVLFKISKNYSDAGEFNAFWCTKDSLLSIKPIFDSENNSIIKSRDLENVTIKNYLDTVKVINRNYFRY